MRSAFFMSPSSNSAIVASAAAQHTGLPPNVEACAPGGQVIRSARATVAPSGIPLAIPLATARISGTAPKCSAAHILPVRPIPDCTSSKIRRIPFWLATRASSSKNFFGGTTYPPSPCTGSSTMAAVSTAQVAGSRPNGHR